MKIENLNHVALYVTDLNQSCKFYREVLELEAMARTAFNFPGAWFRLGSHQELHLIGDRGTPVIRTNENNHLALQVDDIDAWEHHLMEIGARYRPKKRRPDGAWQLFLSDPDGHSIELFTPPV